MSRFVLRLVVCMLAASLGIGAPSGAADVQDEPLDETTVYKIVSLLEVMTDWERQQVLPSVFTIVANQPDKAVRERLTEALKRTLEQTAPDETAFVQRQQDWFLEQVRPNPGAQESFQALLEERQKPMPSEAEIREQIDTLTLDLDKPEIGLTHAMVEIGGVIDRIEDPKLQVTLRDQLMRKLVVLQADCDKCK